MQQTRYRPTTPNIVLQGGGGDKCMYRLPFSAAPLPPPLPAPPGPFPPPYNHTQLMRQGTRDRASNGRRRRRIMSDGP